MRETVIVFSILILGFLGSLVVSLKNGNSLNVQAQQEQPKTAQTLTQPGSTLVADVPPPEDRGTPGQRT